MSIKNPIWKGNTSIEVVKNDSLTAMEHHANKQIESLREQANLLVKQAEEIRNRVELAHLISTARFGFKPVLLKPYYLYRDKEGNLTLTLIAPEEWKTIPSYGECIATVRQLGDSTWEKIIKEKE